MSGLKRNQPALRVAKSEFAITPDEQDRYEVYDIIFPIGAEAFIGTCAVAGTSAEAAVVVDNRLPDYPRSLEVVHLGTGDGMAGSMILNGRDQFGAEIAETFSITAANNGGTQPGTKVFRQVDSGTFYYGTAVGSGTVSLGVGTTGTTALFGLPVKINGTSDVISLTYSTEMTQTAINGGTVAAFVNSPMHAIASPVDVVGTMTMQVWVNPTYNNENSGRMASGTLIV